jgi:acyl-CoA thioesterase FadM
VVVRRRSRYTAGVNLLFRLLWVLLVARFRPRCDPLGPVRTPFRVVPTDLDVLRHVNNGVYLSLLDIARLDLLIRSGLFRRVRARGWYPVVTSESIRFRRPLTLFEKFHVETRVLGWDDRSIYVDQRFVRRGDVIASALVVGRFLHTGGSIPPARVLALTDTDLAESPPLPEWAARLGEAHQGLGREASTEEEPDHEA